MRDSWIDEVHMSASWLCSLFLSHLLSLGSSDRSHSACVAASCCGRCGCVLVLVLCIEELNLLRTNGKTEARLLVIEVPVIGLEVCRIGSGA